MHALRFYSDVIMLIMANQTDISLATFSLLLIVQRVEILEALTFRLGDGVADLGLDVMLTVRGEDEGQAEETHAHTVKSKTSGLFVCLGFSSASIFLNPRPDEERDESRHAPSTCKPPPLSI